MKTVYQGMQGQGNDSEGNKSISNVSLRETCNTHSICLNKIGSNDLRQKAMLGTLRDNFKGLRIAMNDRQSKIHSYRITQTVIGIKVKKLENIAVE